MAAKKPSFLQPLLRCPDEPHHIVNSRTGETVVSEILTAFDSAARRTGLLRHDNLPEGTALVIAPCSAVHTIRMRFAIDIAFVARDGRIIKIAAAVPPWRMAAALTAFAVVELRAGALESTHTVVGDCFVVRRRND